MPSTSGWADVKSVLPWHRFRLEIRCTLSWKIANNLLHYIDVLVQGFHDVIMEILQSCTKPSIYNNIALTPVVPKWSALRCCVRKRLRVLQQGIKSQQIEFHLQSKNIDREVVPMVQLQLILSFGHSAWPGYLTLEFFVMFYPFQENMGYYTQYQGTFDNTLRARHDGRQFVDIFKLIIYNEICCISIQIWLKCV